MRRTSHRSKVDSWQARAFLLQPEHRKCEGLCGRRADTVTYRKGEDGELVPMAMSLCCTPKWRQARRAA
jgi:hypothetical protein